MPNDYETVRDALAFLEAHARSQPTLSEVAGHVGLSPGHFQRLFGRWVGISPKRFLQLVTLEHAKEALVSSASVLDATYASGLSSPGRLHDLFVTVQAVTPGTYRRSGDGLTIHTGVHDSPFGYCLLAVTDRGVCGLSFHDDAACERGLEDVRARWPRADIVASEAVTTPVAENLFGPMREASRAPLTLVVRGTNFQSQVWQALLQVSAGQLTTYGDIARRIGRPSAARAVGAAVGSNPIAWLIPCHRVIASSGTFGGYRWDPLRKKAMIGWEMARAREPDAEPPSPRDADATATGAHDSSAAKPASRDAGG